MRIVFLLGYGLSLLGIANILNILTNTQINLTASIAELILGLALLIIFFVLNDKNGSK